MGPLAESMRARTMYPNKGAVGVVEAVEVHAGCQNAVRVGFFGLCTRMRPNQVLEGVVIVRVWPAHMPPKRYRARRL